MSQVFCSQCGAANPSEAKFCASCGQQIQQAQTAPPQPHYQQPPQPPPPAATPPPPPAQQSPPVYHQSQNVYQQAPEPNPIGTGEWLGFGCLTFFIPLVGLILSIVWMSQKRPGAGGCLAATIIYMVLGAVLYFVFMVMGLAGGMMEGGY